MNTYKPMDPGNLIGGYTLKETRPHHLWGWCLTSAEGQDNFHIRERDIFNVSKENFLQEAEVRRDGEYKYQEE